MVDAGHYEFGRYRLNIASRELRQDCELVELPYRVFDCLAYLVEHRDRAVGRDELVAAVWGRADVSDAQLGQIILRVRRAVGDDGNVQQSVRTMPKFGYRWVVETRRAVGVPDATPDAPSPPPVRDAIDAAQPEGSEWRPRAARPIAAAWHVPVLALALMALALLVVWLVDGTRQAKPDTAADATFVLPLHIEAEQEYDWARLGAMDLIAARLRAAGLAVPSTESALLQLHGEPLAAKDKSAHTDSNAMRRALNAGMLVMGRAQRTGQHWHLTLEASRRHGLTVRVQSEAGDILAAARRGSDQLLIELGMTPQPLGKTDAGLDEVLQRAQAATLVNQLDVARSILADAPVLMHDEPRLRYLRSQLDLRAGRLPQVIASMEDLLQDPSLPRDPQLHGAVLNTLASSHYNLDDAPTAERYYNEAVNVLLDANASLELGRAYGGRGAAKGAQLRFDEAMNDFGLARMHLGRAGDRLVMARVDQVAASLELRRQRLRPARALLEQSIPVVESMGAINEVLYGLALLTRVELAELDYQAAQAASDRAWALRDRATDPESRYVMAVNRAEIALSLGRGGEAAALLSSLKNEAAPTNAWALGIADWMRARVAWARADAAQTLLFTEQAQRHIDPSIHDQTAARLFLLRQRALLRLGRAGEAEEALAAYERTYAGQPDATIPLELHLARAERFRREGRAAEADASFRAAMRRAETTAVPDLIVQAGEGYADFLLAQGRRGDAGAIIGQLSPWSTRDYRLAVLQVRFYHALGEEAAWSRALRLATTLAGERAVPEGLRRPPARLQLSADVP